MADITMCSGKGCPKKATCYRFNATPNEWRQSYFLTEPNDGAVCAEYIGAYDITGAEPPPPDSGFAKL
jgi:hypothetical protein